jgi:hypothetical protein
MLRVPFDFVVDSDQTHLALAFPIPALRQKPQGRGTHCVGDARKIKSPGHPPELI